MRVVEVVERVVADVALDGERRQARLRVIATAGFAVLWPLLCQFADDKTALVPVEAVCLGALALSLLVWGWVRRSATTSGSFSLASVMLDVAIAPLLWRLEHYGIELPRQAAPLAKYAERLFSRPAFIDAMTPSEKVMRK